MTTMTMTTATATTAPYDLKPLAYSLARYLLRNKVDRHGDPLIGHCIRVATRCADMGLSDEQQIAAILHDCIEDGELIENPSPGNLGSILLAIFGREIHDLVWGLTRSTMSYNDYIEWLAEDPVLAAIKLADLADNLDPSRGPISDSLRERYEKAQAYLLQFQSQTQKGETKS